MGADPLQSHRSVHQRTGKTMTHEGVGQTSFDTWVVYGPCGDGYSISRNLIAYCEHRVMHSKFDRRILSDVAIQFVRAVQRFAPCRLGGGSALAGASLDLRAFGS